jgi:hypothetical protein
MRRRSSSCAVNGWPPIPAAGFPTQGSDTSQRRRQLRHTEWVDRPTRPVRRIPQRGHGRSWMVTLCMAAMFPDNRGAVWGRGSAGNFEGNSTARIRPWCAWIVPPASRMRFPSLNTIALLFSSWTRRGGRQYVPLRYCPLSMMLHLERLPELLRDGSDLRIACCTVPGRLTTQLVSSQGGLPAKRKCRLACSASSR